MSHAAGKKDGFHDVVFPAMANQLVIRGSVESTRGDLEYWTGGELNGKSVVGALTSNTEPGGSRPHFCCELVETSGEDSFGCEDFVFEKFMALEDIRTAGDPSSRLVYVLNYDLSTHRNKVTEPEGSTRFRDHVVRAHLFLGLVLADTYRIHPDPYDEFRKAKAVYRLMYDRMEQFLMKQLKERERALEMLREGRSTWSCKNR